MAVIKLIKKPIPQTKEQIRSRCRAIYQNYLEKRLNMEFSTFAQKTGLYKYLRDRKDLVNYRFNDEQLLRLMCGYFEDRKISIHLTDEKRIYVKDLPAYIA